MNYKDKTLGVCFIGS